MPMTKVQKLIRQYNSLSWSEKAVAIHAYHKSKQEQHGTPTKGHKVRGTWSIRDTARELSMSLGILSEIINVVEASNKFDSSILKESTLMKAIHRTGRRANATS